MKKYFVVLLILFACVGRSDSWTKYSGNPIISPSSTSGRFDDGYVAAPTITVRLLGTSTYRIYYTGGHTGDVTCREKTGIAETTDWVTFTKIDGPASEQSVMGCSTSGKFDYDRAWLSAGTIIQESTDSWKAWYPGDSDISAAHRARMGYATSTDGITWTKYTGSGYGGSIFDDITGLNCASGCGVIAMNVINDNGTYRMLYNAYPTSEVRYATSSDGITWTKQNGGNAVMNISGAMSLIKIGSAYYCYTMNASYQIVVYTSSDMITWSLGSVQLSPGSGWESHILYYANRFDDSSTGWQYLVYSATSNADTDQKIGYAYNAGTAAGNAGIANLGNLGRISNLGNAGYIGNMK